MKKLSFEAFAKNQICTSSLKSVTGGDTAGGGSWGKNSAGDDMYISWTSDYTDSAGGNRLRGYNVTVFHEC